MDRGFRLSVFLCGLMSTDSIVSSYGEQIRKENAQVLILSTFVTAQITSPTDCKTSTPDKPTPSPKKNKSSCDVFFEESNNNVNVTLSRDASVRDFYSCNHATTAAVSPSSTADKFNSEESSPSVTPGLNFSVSPSTESLQGLDLNKRETDCATSTPSPLKSSPSKK